jgi:hypothetical protein
MQRPKPDDEPNRQRRPGSDAEPTRPDTPPSKPEVTPLDEDKNLEDGIEVNET